MSKKRPPKRIHHTHKTAKTKTARTASDKSATTRGPKKPSQVEPRPKPDTDDLPPGTGKSIPLPDPTLTRLWRLFQRLSLYADDVLAVVLYGVAALSILGLFGWSSGVWLSAWIDFLAAWFGWGAILIPSAMIWVATIITLRNFGRIITVRWWRVIVGEVGAFAVLGLLNRAHGGNAALAAAGEGGGLVGWGLGYMVSRVFPSPADGFVLGLVAFVSLFISFDVTYNRLREVLDWARAQTFAEETSPTPSTLPPITRPTPRPRQLRLDEAKKEKEKEREKDKKKSKIAPHERVRVQVEMADEEPKRKAKVKKRAGHLPGLELLDDGNLSRPSQKDIDETASIILKTLKEFGVVVHPEVGARVGPSVTQYQVRPGFVEKAATDGVRQWKIRVAQIASLEKDLALALSASSLRIEAPVPGTNYVGIEVPHNRTSRVGLRPVVESEAFRKLESPLSLALGRDVSGAAVAADLTKMPHLLIAGTTGSGKSVCITALTLCLVTNNTPEDLRLIMLDPKRVELMRFNGLPHLYGKVETDLDRMIGSLKWTVREMERRYKLFEQTGVRNLDTYNTKTSKQSDAERLPRLVVLVDELADLMMQAPDETERTIVRLAQMARATGIHLVVATQRPSVDVVTGLIKANFPARIAFAVAASVDSRVILDQVGAESLLGKGDMLFLSPEIGAPQRLQGCFVSDREVERVVEYWVEQTEEEEAEEEEAIEAEDELEIPTASTPSAAPWDEMLAREAVLAGKDQQLEQAIEIVKKHGTASASLLQRKMRLGYPRAAALMDELKRMGLVGREQAGGKTREVFVRPEDDPIGQRAARILGAEDDDE